MKKTLKILIMIISVFGIYMVYSKVNAASANLNVSSTQVKVGDTVNVSVHVNAASWEIHVGGSVKGDYSDTSSDGNNTSFNTPNLSFKPTAPGSYTIELSGNVTDGDSTSGQATDVSDKKTIIVTENVAQSTQQTQQTQQTQPAELQFSNANLTMYTTRPLNIRNSSSLQGKIITTLQVGTEVKISAKSTSKRDEFYWYKVTAAGQTGYIADMNLTSIKPAETDENKDKEEEKKEKSTNKALKDLVIENYKLTPEFDADVTKYSVEVPKNVDKLEISGITQDENAKVEITGNDNLKVGNNIVKVTVTAEDGTTRIYTITVTKTNKEADETSSKLRLKTLEIKNATLIPNFSAEETNYTISISDPSSLKTEDITAVAEDSDVTIKIALSEDTSSDERLITIMLEKKDGDNQETNSYQIAVKKATNNPIANLANKKDNKIYYILGGIIAVLVLFIIIIIVLLRKTSTKYDDEYDVQNEDELDDNYDYSLKNAIDEAKSEFPDEENSNFDDMVDSSNVKSQILNAKDYNVFNDSGDGVGVDEETRKFDFNDNDEFKTKKKGKHF